MSKHERHKLSQRTYRAKNRERLNYKSLIRSRDKRSKIRAIKLKLGCSRCGFNRHAPALDFHHIDPAQKLNRVSRLHPYNWEKILAEIAKCKVLCRNCHMEIEYPDEYHQNPDPSSLPLSKRWLYVG